MAFRRVFAYNRMLVRNLLVAGPRSHQIRKTPFQASHCPQNGRRCLSVSAPLSADNKVATKNETDWNRAVSEAERIVGYPTSFLNLRWILNDEIANVALHLRKIIGSNHPLLKTAKSLLYQGKTTNNQAWGLVVLLISKAAGHSPSVPDMDQDKAAGVLHSQRGLAEITEMIRISILIHQSMVNLQPLMAAGNDLSEFSDDTFGNKIGLLTGDYLLSVSCNELSSLRNQFVIEHMSSAVRDLAEGEFVGDRDEQNNPLPSRPKPHSAEAEVVDDFDFDILFQKLDLKAALGNPEREWTVRNLLSTGSLLGKACLSSLLLAGRPKDMQHKAYLVGKHLALAWQAAIDMEPFHLAEIPPDATFNLVSAPVLFHLNAHPESYALIEKGKQHVENVDFVKLHAEIIKGPGLEKTRELQRKHILSALNTLDGFEKTDARTALQNIALAMQDL